MKPISGKILWLGFLIALVLLVQGRGGGSVLEPTMVEHSAPRIRGEVIEGQGDEPLAFSQSLLATGPFIHVLKSEVTTKCPSCERHCPEPC